MGFLFFARRCYSGPDMGRWFVVMFGETPESCASCMAVVNDFGELMPVEG